MSRSESPDFLVNLRDMVTPDINKYAQLSQAIISAIENGYWKTGDQLPAERDIADWTSLSLGTVQRALRALVDQGVVKRTQGSGTFVNVSRAQMEAPWHARFLNDDASGFLPVFPKLILRRRTKTNGPWSDYLGTHHQSVIRIDRRLNINDEFSVYSKLFVNAERFGRLLELPVRRIEAANLKTLIKRVFNVSISSIAQRIVITKLAPDVAKIIGVVAGGEGMLMECLAASGPSVVYYQELYIPPNRRRLVVADKDDLWLKVP